MSKNGGDNSREKNRPEPTLNEPILFQPSLDLSGTSDNSAVSSNGHQIRARERKMVDAQSTLERAQSALQKAALLQTEANQHAKETQTEFAELRKQIALEIAQTAEPEIYRSYLEAQDREHQASLQLEQILDEQRTPDINSIEQDVEQPGILTDQHPDSSSWDVGSPDQTRRWQEANEAHRTAQQDMQDLVERLINSGLWSQIRENVAVQDAHQAYQDALHEYLHRVAQWNSIRSLVIDSRTTYERYWGETEQATGRAGIHTNYSSSDQTKKVVAHVFGRAFSEHDIAHLAGAQPGDTVNIRSMTPHGFQVDLNRPNLKVVRFQIERLSSGDIVARNPYISVRNLYAPPDKGGASQILQTLCMWQDTGIKKVYATAGVGDQDSSYTLLARLHFDGDIPETGVDLYGNASNVRQEAQAQFGAHVTRVSQLWHAPGGQRWWAQHGTAWDAVLDLTPGTPAKAHLDRYRRHIPSEKI